jgi:DNA-binding FadR family transcriptional regulator
MQSRAAPRTVRDTIVEELLREVVAGDLAAGERVTEEGLAEQFGRSRGMVREALKLLEQLGVVAIGHGVGSRVRPEEDWELLDPALFDALLEAGQARRLLAECVELARAAATEAAALAAERATPEALERIRAAVEALPGARDPLRADAEVHAAIAGASSNRVLAHTLRPLRDALERAARALGLQAEAARLHECDEALVNAIEAGDADAARAAMTRYLDLLDAAD